MSANRYQWRAFVGPRYETAESASRFEWWTPANLTDPAVPLESTLGDGILTIVLPYVSFDARGGVWVGPNGAGEAWEYVAYTGKTATDLTGCIREPAATREHNGVHTAGADVRQWLPLDTNDGALRLAEQIDNGLNAITWQAQIGGWRAPQPALRDGHAIVVQTSENGGSWTTLLIGFLRDVRITDDGARRAQWAATIVSPAAILQGHRAPGLRVGDFSLAAAASVRSSTVLADTRRESQSGDYVQAAPNVGAESAADEDPNTLWIAEKVMGPAEVAANAPSGYNSFASKIRISRWPGETDRSRYIEWRCAAGSFQDSWLCSATNANQAYIEWNDITTTEGERVIICEDEEVFRRLHPEAEDADLREIGSAFFDGLDLEADSVGIYDELFNGWSQTVAWGPSPAVKPHWENPDSGGDDEDGPNMSGTDACEPPLPGQVIRFYYNSGASQAADHFRTDFLEYAGYLSGTTPAPWLLLTLPEIGLQLDQSITDTAPGAGERLYIADLGGAACTIGLEASGTLQIGLEQITYNDRTVDSVNVVARGAGSTTAAAHSAGDAVLTIFGVTATASPMISAIEWQRTQTPAPTQFIVRISNLNTVRTPEQSGYTDDWATAATVSGHSALDYTLSVSPQRVRHILIQIERMGSDPARPRLNEVRAIVDASTYDSSLAMSADDLAAVVAALTSSAGYNGAVNADSDPGQTIDGITTDNQADAWQVIASLAHFAGGLLNVQRDGQLLVGANDLIAGEYGAESLPHSRIFDAGDLIGIEMEQSAAGTVAQIRIPWRTPDGATSDEARYPATPRTAGQIITLEDAIFPDDETAEDAARAAYIMQRYPVTWALQCAEQQTAIRPGDVVQVGWQFDAEMQEAERLAVVVAADHELAGGLWASVLQCRQVDREEVG
jgi:hypothetical protein